MKDRESSTPDVGALAALRETAAVFSRVIPTVDRSAEHHRWEPGIGPFEEDNQVEMILRELPAQSKSGINTQEPYPDTGRRCDIVIDCDGGTLPVEVKLLRFRLDNGNIDPNMYKSVFSPFPERSSSSLLTDVNKLEKSGFSPPYGLLGLYYEEEDEEYEQLRAENVAEKFVMDVEYWFGLDIETVALEPFDGLRHSHHQRGAVIAWLVSG